MRVPVDVRITLESTRRADIGGRLKSATSGLMHHIAIPGDKVDGSSSTLNKAAAGTKTSRWEIALSFSRTLPMQSAGALLTVIREANAAKAIASRLIRELTEAALVLRGERVTRFNSETASVLPAPAVGAWRFLLLRGTAALDSRLLLPLLRPTASGGLRLLLLRRAAALDLPGCCS